MSKKHNGLLWRVLKIWATCLILAFCVLGVIAVKRVGVPVVTMYREASKDVAKSSKDTFKAEQTSLVYDAEGNEIKKLKQEKDVSYLDYEDIPDAAKLAIISIEDKNFTTHHGIDVEGVARAGLSLILNRGNITMGGSTITQQLLKNNVFTNWTSESTQLERFTRKIQEQYLAVQVEKKTDKDTILENYLNTINLGAGSYGVQAAARQYFDKDIWDLNLSECATLAGITQNPTKFNPIINPDSNRKRRKEVLQHMLDQNYISQDQYDEALADDVYSRIQAAQEKNSSTENTVYTYFEDELTDQIINDLMNIKGYTKTQATNLLYSGGLKVYTTQDSNIQTILDEEYADPSNYPDEVQYELDYALTVTDPDGNQVNYSKEMLQLYFQNEDPSFDLLFDSPEEGQTYVDRYKESILADGSKVFTTFDSSAEISYLVEN